MKILKPKKLPVKVISVGNISLGGTGKTPAIIFFANHLIKRGKKVGIVSRGYGRKNKDIKVLINADNNSKVEDYGDEPMLLSSRLRNIPIAVEGRIAQLVGKRFLRWELEADIFLSLKEKSENFPVGRGSSIVSH